MRYRIAVLDDDRRFLSDFQVNLQTAFAALSHDADIFLFTDPHELSVYLDSPGAQLDIAIVDILLKGDNGVGWAQSMQRKHPEIKLIFITAVIENAQDIFDASPCYFLTKPVQKVKLCAALSAALEQLENDKTRILLVRQKGITASIRLNHLKYIESVGRYLIFHESDRETRILAKLQDYLPRLGEEFLLIHKSFAVNLQFVRSIGKAEAELYSGENLPISRNRLPQVRERFFTLLEKKTSKGKEKWY